MRVDKYIILLGDGMPDEGEITPLMAAKSPTLDRLASLGEVGFVKTTPDGFEPGSDIGNMGLLGYDCNRYYTGRAPIEAAAIGVDLAPDEIAFRANLITLALGSNQVIMEDFSAGHIETHLANELIESLSSNLSSEDIAFYAGVSYRHLMVARGEFSDLTIHPPHNISGENILDYLPKGKGGDKIVDIMNKSQMILKDHPVNKRLAKAGKPVANSIWLWGQGARLSFPTLKGLHNITGAMISAVDLLKGLGSIADMKVVNVEGATGWLDTNFDGKKDALINELANVDLIFLHLEAPDEAGHLGSFDDKVAAIEKLDQLIVEPVVNYLEESNFSFRLMVTSDHPTPWKLRKHTSAPSPYLIYPSISTARNCSNFDETIISNKGSNYFDSALGLNNYFIEGS
ncbi:MAG: cofactor-independent phosphoglycerate mutase [Nitrospinota bacterium]